jgi:hypothetical protein
MKTGFNFWIELNGKSFHIGKWSKKWQFIWNIRSILVAVFCYLDLSPARKEDIKNTIKALETMETGFEIDLYNTLQVKDDIKFRLSSSGVSEKWIKENPWLTTPIDIWTNENNGSVGMRIQIKNINSGLLLYWVSCLFEKGIIVCDNIEDDITWDKFISLITDENKDKNRNELYDFCSFGKYSAGSYLIHWNYKIDNLCCIPLMNF